MKTVGIIGGIGPESTVEYYRLLISTYREQKPDGSYPAIIINSVDLNKLVSLMMANKLAEVTEYLVAELRKLAGAGADFGLLASNTPHIVFDEILRRSPIPLISIVEATRDAAKALGLRKPGLFGTRFTMQGRFYPEVFARAGMTVAIPNERDRAYIHDKYMGELLKNIFLAETREELLSIASRLKESEGIDGLILGGTELPLLLRETTVCGIPLLDTSRIHVKAVVGEILSSP